MCRAASLSCWDLEGSDDIVDIVIKGSSRELDWKSSIRNDVIIEEQAWATAMVQYLLKSRFQGSFIVNTTIYM